MSTFNAEKNVFTDVEGKLHVPCMLAVSPLHWPGAIPLSDLKKKAKKTTCQLISSSKS